MTISRAQFREAIRRGIPQDYLPPPARFDDSISRAPARRMPLDAADQRLAVANALRYVPERHHRFVAKEFRDELTGRGRIYGYRYRPTWPIHARPAGDYPANILEAAAIMHNVDNNLDPAVALFPYELTTYGSNGQVCQNWMQYRGIMQLLAVMTREQTLHVHSGDPRGLFPSHPEAPRVVLTNGVIVPEFGGDFDRLAALGVVNYGQMTAGGWIYIGPQGIVHGTAITYMTAGRVYLGLKPGETLAGKVIVTSGLGGMSGAQGKAARINGAVGVIAEVDPKALKKRLNQGWIDDATSSLDTVAARIDAARRAGAALALGYQGNVVDLWEFLASQGIKVDLGSDQTSLHNAYGGGYIPAGLELEAAREMVARDSDGFKAQVDASLRRQTIAINTLDERGMHFFDYGNFFLEAARRAGAAITNPDGGFRFPSYVDGLMGPYYFDYGFGPFRWVCSSGRPRDLQTTDRIAARVIAELARQAPPEIQQQYRDNLAWIKTAGRNKLVVGSQARILYSDMKGREALGLAFNRGIADGTLQGPIFLGRDHHDTGGTDSPRRETSGLTDGSGPTADMAIHSAIGAGFRGATLVALHNGGGVGWNRAVNGGFGMVIDGTPEAEARIRRFFRWDVGNGIARRSWSGQPNARFAVEAAMRENPGLKVSLPHRVDPVVLDAAFAD